MSECAGCLLRSDLTRSSSAITTHSLFLYTSIASSISRRSHTRPVGLCGLQKIAYMDVICLLTWHPCLHNPSARFLFRLFERTVYNLVSILCDEFGESDVSRAVKKYSISRCGKSCQSRDYPPNTPFSYPIYSGISPSTLLRILCQRMIES